MATKERKFGPLVGAIDQGTSSSRFLVFAAKSAELLTFHQAPVQRIYPKEGWVEQDPKELLQTVVTCIDETIKNLKNLDIDPKGIVTVGIANQRETSIIWDKTTGEPLYNAIVWLDNRTAATVQKIISQIPNRNKEYLRPLCGLPISTYFSALKFRWLLDNVPVIKKAIAEKRCMFGTVDSWLIWNLTGGKAGGLHLTDVTNASRTMLMNIETLQWDPSLCDFFKIPSTVLPEIRSSSEIYGYLTCSALQGVPISGCLGDQQAALVGQMCFKQGQAKNTYGTGCFLLYNTGGSLVHSSHGLLTTVAYRLGPDAPITYALEGSIAAAGAANSWLKNGLGIVQNLEEVEKLASSVKNTGDVFFVPAFSGLYAPHWRTDARGIICGLTEYTTKAHIARASLEAICYQTRDILEAMNKDSGIPLSLLLVDGGMTSNSLLLQLQADILGIPTVRPSMAETTALGAAMAAGNAKGIGVWSLKPEEASTVTTDRFEPSVPENERNIRYNKWRCAVEKSFGWENYENGQQNMPDEQYRILASIPGAWFLFSSFGLLALAKEIGRSVR